MVDTPGLAAEWLNCLQDSGYKLTRTRRVLVELLASSTHAYGPIELYDAARERCPGLGLVTVYRTLEKLEELSLVQRLHQPDGCHRYLRATQGHQHVMVCSGCGEVEVFSGDNLEPLFHRLADQTGYSIEQHWLQLFGLCPACQAAERQAEA